MTKKAWLALSIVAAAFLIIGIGAKAHAWTAFRSGNSANVASSETLDSSLWIGARDVDIAGTVNGDVFCGAQTLNISGTVKGDVICAAQTINISGNVEGSVRLAGQTVNLTGSVGRSAAIAGQTINIDSKSQIGSDASIAGNDINLSGRVGRDLSAAGATLDLNGQVGRDVKSTVGKITLTKDAKVGGGIDYTSKTKISLLSDSQVAGNITQHQPKVRGGHIPSLLFFGTATVFIVIMLIGSALIATALLPQFIHRVSGQGMRRPWIALLTGLGASVLMPMLFILLAITVVGIPLAILLLLSWLLINLSSGLFSAYWVGRRLWSGQSNAMLLILAGSLILIALYLIPIVGVIVLVLAAWLGEGMLILEIGSHLTRPKYQVK